MQSWQQLEKLSSSIKATVSYGMNPGDLFGSENMMQLQVSLLVLVEGDKTEGVQNSVDIQSSTWRNERGTLMTPP